MNKAIKRFVSQCDSCQRIKASNRPRHAIQPVEVPCAPGEVLSLDFLEVPQSLRGHNYILTICDKFTKLVKIRATTKEITAEGAAELVLTTILPTFGRLPSALVSDRDPRFTAELWTSLWRSLQVDLRMTTAHRPQGDGQTERANRQILEYLRHYVNVAGSDWDLPVHLAQLEFAINSKVSSATGVSPLELHLGRPPVPPAALGQRTESAAGPDASVQSKWRLARDAMHEAGDRMMSDQGAKSTTPAQRVTAGDKVLLHLRNYPQFRAHKLTAPYIGPFVVKGVPSLTTVELDIPKRFRIHKVINIDQLKRYNEGEGHVQKPPPPPLKDAQGRDMFIIDRILMQRKYRNRQQYLVRWAGYGPGDDSWEDEGQLKKTDALRDFKLSIPVIHRGGAVV
jgi:hypothetical protein